MKKLFTLLSLFSVVVLFMSSCAPKRGFYASHESSYSGYKFTDGNWNPSQQHAPVIKASVATADDLTQSNQKVLSSAERLYEGSPVASLTHVAADGDKRKKPSAQSSNAEVSSALNMDAEKETTSASEHTKTSKATSKSELKELRKLRRKARRDPNGEAAQTFKEKIREKMMDPTAEDLLLLILCLILPWLAIFIFEDGMTTNFWIDLILWLVGVTSFWFFEGLLLLLSILFALYVIFLA